MVGTEGAANARFQNPAQQASANYGVRLDGSIVCWVHEVDTAYANGTYYDNPGANVDSISIEHEDNGDYNGPRTPALYEASAQLVADICNRRSIPVDRTHIIKHLECFQAATACPDALNVDGIVIRAQALSLHGGGGSTLGGKEVLDAKDPVVIGLVNGIKSTYDLVKALGTSGVKVDETAVLAAIADLKAHPAAGDPAVLAIVTRIETALKGA